jgi:diaminopimelate decarboxylase
MMYSSIITEKLHSYKTPFYLYDLGLLKKTLASAAKCANEKGYIVHYALKANVNPKVLALIIENGFGADCVSGNEVKRAVESGFHPSHIAFAGVGKSDEEINYALDQDIFCFNCESIQELQVIDELAEVKGKKAKVALRINPNVNANTHHYITTGLEENKFGINQWELEDVTEKIRSLKNIELIGIHFHIGSQITDLQVFKSLCIKVNELQKWFVSRKIILEHINVGGGLGIDYYHPNENSIPDFESYFQVFSDFLELQPHQKLHFELGRALVGQSASLISKVLYIKKGINTNFAILDAGMTELIRPALYQSYHKTENISNPDGEIHRYDVVGPICESSDCFGKAQMLPETKRGDLMAIRSTGAYGEVMVSAYNLREQNPAVYLEESGEFVVQAS